MHSVIHLYRVGIITLGTVPICNSKQHALQQLKCKSVLQQNFISFHHKPKGCEIVGFTGQKSQIFASSELMKDFVNSRMTPA